MHQEEKSVPDAAAPGKYPVKLLILRSTSLAVSNLLWRIFIFVFVYISCCNVKYFYVLCKMTDQSDRYILFDLICMLLVYAFSILNVKL